LESFRIRLAGKWRAAIDAGISTGLSLRDHVELQLGNGI